MNDVDQLRRAAFEAAWARRESGSLTTRDVEQLVSRWRLAPFVARFSQFGQAADVSEAIEAAVQERTAGLEEQVRLARRRAVLAEARLAAIEVQVD